VEVLVGFEKVLLAIPGERSAVKDLAFNPLLEWWGF
jgi:hypothetical protein